MSLTREEVKNIAMLARVGLSDEEIDTMGEELNSILSYVERLQKIDTTNIPEATSPMILASDFRPDTANTRNEAEQALIINNFPASHRGMLNVPPVFERPKQ